MESSVLRHHCAPICQNNVTDTREGNLTFNFYFYVTVSKRKVNSINCKRNNCKSKLLNPPNGHLKRGYLTLN